MAFPSFWHKKRPKRKHVLLLLLMVLLLIGVVFVLLNGKLHLLHGQVLLGSGSLTPTMVAQPGNYPYVVATTIPNAVTGTAFEPAPAVPLANLNWCRYNSELPRFWDYGGNATALPTIVTDWTQIQQQLGFPIYLPKALTADACLVSIEGDLHNPSGNTFRIIYSYYQRNYTYRYLLQEQPAQGTVANLQCEDLVKAGNLALEPYFDAVPTGPTNPEPGFCTGQHAQTAITFQAPEDIQQMVTDFQAFQADVAFIPICHCQNTNEHILRVHA